MNTHIISYHIFPLGDSALTIDYGNIIDEQVNKEVIARAAQMKENLADIIEVAPAYSSLTIYFDLLKLKKQSPKDKLVYDYLKERVEKLLQQPLQLKENQDRFIKIPVCYEPEFATDIHTVAIANNITVEEVVTLHFSKTYRVYMLGFLPGFSYMGELDEKIATPRKPQPQTVAPGSVGIAGRQTGVYPLASPGGWQIIGRTPLMLFDAGADDPALLRAGDHVEFFSITKNDFYDIQNSPLPQE
ncbi:MAG: 5-oxoprolinase subunit PxpB [Chitinophagaceae bacterium]